MSRIKDVLEELVTRLEQKPETLAALLDILDPIDLAAFAEVGMWAERRRKRREALRSTLAPVPEEDA